MQGSIGSGCTARVLAAAPTPKSCSSSGAEQGSVYSTSTININVPISTAPWGKIRLPAHGCLGQPGHYPFPEAETRSRLWFPAPVLANQPVRGASCSWELTSHCDEPQLFIPALALQWQAKPTQPSHSEKFEWVKVQTDLIFFGGKSFSPAGFDGETRYIHQGNHYFDTSELQAAFNTKAKGA